MEEIVSEAMAVLEPVQEAVLGGWQYYSNSDYGSCGDKCLTYSDGAPRGYTEATRKYWVWILRDVEGFYLQVGRRLAAHKAPLVCGAPTTQNVP